MVSLSPITPAVTYEVPLLLLAGHGTVGVFSFVVTSDVQTCTDWTTIETGGATIDPTALHQQVAEYVSALGQRRK